jgi:hypothetical protein
MTAASKLTPRRKAAGGAAANRGLALGGIGRVDQLQLAQPVMTLRWGYLL